MVFPPTPYTTAREGEHTQVERSHVLPTVLRAAPRVLPRARNKPALLLLLRRRRVIENFRQTRSKPSAAVAASHRAARDCDRSVETVCAPRPSRYENLLWRTSENVVKPTFPISFDEGEGRRGEVMRIFESNADGRRK